VSSLIQTVTHKQVSGISSFQILALTVVIWCRIFVFLLRIFRKMLI